MILRDYTKNDESLVKQCLDSLSMDSYSEYTKDSTDGNIIRCYLSEEPHGVVYEKKDEKAIKFVISFIGDDISPQDGLMIKNLIMENTQDKKIELVINGYNKKLLSQLLGVGFLQDYSFLVYEYENTSPYIYENDNLNFKPYTKDHGDDFIKLLGEAFAPLRKDNDLKPYNWYAANQEIALKEFTDNAKKDEIYGMWDNGQLIGITIVEEDDIDILAVSIEHQGKGYGTRMLKYLLDQMINVKKMPKVYLGVATTNTGAQKLYKRHGFKEVNKVDYLKHS